MRPIAAPASWRRRTRSRRCALARRTVTGWSSSTSSSPATACRSCFTTTPSTARPTAARAATPDLRRALLVERIPADWAARLSRLACTAFDVDHRELHADIIAAAHQSGYKVMTYTANEPHAVTQLAAWGVDVIITDAIDVIRP